MEAAPVARMPTGGEPGRYAKADPLLAQKGLS